MCDSTGCFFLHSKKENGRSVPDLTASPGRAPPGPMPANQGQNMSRQGGNNSSGVKEPVLLQGDFRKVSGISSEIFRQIEAVENDHDPSTAAALEAVERRGEMIVRILEPRCIGGRQAVDAAQKLMAKGDARHTVQLVEIVKRPGQTLGLYIREGNGADRSDGVFISRIALESAVYNSGCLRVGDEILAVNLVDVTRMSLDDVVIIMSIPRRLVLAIRQRRGGRGANSPGPPPLSRPEQKPPPVVVIKRDLRDEDIMDHESGGSRSRSSRERRTGDGREMTESRSRLGLGLNNYSPQSEQLDLYYNSRPNQINEPPNWGYKPPPPPSVITEQPKGNHSFTPSHAYYQNAGTLESLAEKVHSFYPGQPTSRRMSAGGDRGIGISQSHNRFPRSGSDQHLPTYGDYSSLGRHSLLRSSLKSGTVVSGGTLGRYGRYEPSPTSRTTSKYGTTTSSTLQRQRPRPSLDYSSDTEATIGPRPGYYYYNRPNLSSITSRGSTTALGGGPDFNKFNSLPRDRPSATRINFRSRIGDRLLDESDGNLSAPELPPHNRRDRGAAMLDIRSRMTASPSIFTSDEYRAWLRRAPSSSAICDQMKLPRDILTQQRGQRFSCSAENIHDALRNVGAFNTDSIYSSRVGGGVTSTLDRHLGIQRGLSSVPVRSLSSQHLGSSSIRSPSVRRLRQLLELSAPGAGGPGSPSSTYSGLSGGHQSPAPTPSTTLPRAHHRQIDINPAEFSKYKLDKPVLDSVGISGMLWIHLLAGRGLRSSPEGTQTTQTNVRDLYCVLECDRVHKARTVVRSGDLQFDWDESFELDLVCNKQLDVLVYSWDPQHRHKLCYRGALSLTTLLRQSPLHQLALKVEPRGTIYLRIRHTDPGTLYRRRGISMIRSGHSQLFGGDLETVVTREAKGAPGSAPVPIVLRRCVEEVERRGLDIIGLYRLCGSASKKRLLRETFERNSRTVELSPEHVPDINVITGVLKDYLRELPEPLFTRCLFQMTVDALAVCLPDDPEGNAKLMLSILDCLPRANRATLVFLLDHLSLVVSASERNKMSAQALATVMGPPLMLHSSSTVPGDEIDHAQPIAVLKYLLQIWPQPQHSGAVTSTSGRRGEPVGQRGNKASALQAARPQAQTSLLHISPSLANTQSIGHHQLLATPSIHQSQSAAGQLVQSPRLSPQVGQQPHLSVGSADLVGRDRSPQPATPSPGSSSSSTATGSGSGTDTIKRGASPAASVSSSSTSKFKDSGSSYSIRHDIPDISTTTSTSSYETTRTNGTARSLSMTSSIITTTSPLSSTTYTSTATTHSSNIYGPKTTSSSSDLYPSRSVLFSTSSNDMTTKAATASAPPPLPPPKTTTSSSSQSSTAASNYSLNKDSYKISSASSSNISSRFPLTTSYSSSTQSSQPAATSIGISSASSSSILKSSLTSTSTATSKPESSINKDSGYSSYTKPSEPTASSTSSGSSIMSSYKLPSFQFPSSKFNFDDFISTASAMRISLGGSSSSTTTSSTTSSPSRIITSNTSTLPSSSVARNMLYQSESLYSNKPNQTTNVTTSGNSTINYSQSQTMNLYGTLPKTSNPLSSSSSTSSYYQYSTAGVLASSANTTSGETSSSYSSSNLFDRNDYTTTATNRNHEVSTTSNGGSSSLGPYRVQYSSTNPFLPTFNPPPSDQPVSPVPTISLNVTDKIDEE